MQAKQEPRRRKRVEDRVEDGFAKDDLVPRAPKMGLFRKKEVDGYLRRIRAMRFAPWVVAALFLSGCASTQPYSRQDLTQVREAYATIVPLYQDFKRAAIAGNSREIVRDYRREVVACRVNDAVDRRDTIDATTNLFAVSAELDDLCNAMDSAYAGWAKSHGRPYPKDVVPGRLADEFIPADKDLALMPQQIAHPKAQY